MADSWVIKYTNLSSHDLQISPWQGTPLDSIHNVPHQPAGTLAKGESDYLSFDQSGGKWIADGDITIEQSVSFQNKSLWVKLHAPLQVMGVGSEPYWYYATTDGLYPGNWGDKYYGDSKTASFSGLSVKLTGNAHHSTLTVDVVFEDQS